MNITYFPYKWRRNTIVDNIMTAYYNIIYGIENLFVWFKVIWADRDWDWTFITYMLRFKLNRVANNFEKYNHHLNTEKEIKNIRICIALLDRIENECDYYHKVAKFPNVNKYDRIEYMKKQDLALFAKIFSRHLRSWWD